MDSERAAGRTPQRLLAGRVGRAHGLDGSFYVAQARIRLLAPGTVVTVDQTRRAVVRLAGTAQRPLVSLAGIEDRDRVQALHGLELTVEGARAPSLGDGEWWAEELEGCTVVAGELVLGAVARLIELPSCEALDVRPPGGGGSLLVPMVKDAVLAVSVDDRRIEVNLDFLGLQHVADVPSRAGARARPRRGGGRS
ncbi:MAG TPA: ribosome maturation factor RimM [Solirubrobacteraceae bacterium]|nr:ribosome maturation factor RimM [Solirubrobacteraceae bacterium]